MKYFKLLLVVILVVSLPIITNAYSCGDEYDDCCNGCHYNYTQTGHYTDCYNNCYNNYDHCLHKDDDNGCFITVCYSSYSNSFDITEKEKIAAKKATWKKVKVKRISVLNRCLTFINSAP